MIQTIDSADIKAVIEKIHCADHGGHPYVTVTENKMTIISGCCLRFQAECINLAKALAQMLDLTELIIE